MLLILLPLHLLFHCTLYSLCNFFFPIYFLDFIPYLFKQFILMYFIDFIPKIIYSNVFYFKPKLSSSNLFWSILFYSIHDSKGGTGIDFILFCLTSDFFSILILFPIWFHPPIDGKGSVARKLGSKIFKIRKKSSNGNI